MNEENLIANILFLFGFGETKGIDPESFRSWRDHRGEQNAIVAPPRSYGVFFGARNRRVSESPFPQPLALQTSRTDGDLGRRIAMSFALIECGTSELEPFPPNDLGQNCITP